MGWVYLVGFSLRVAETTRGWRTARRSDSVARGSGTGDEELYTADVMEEHMRSYTRCGGGVSTLLPLLLGLGSCPRAKA
jgi:hypothetical protein